STTRTRLVMIADHVPFGVLKVHDFCWSRARLSSRTLTVFSPKMPRSRPPVWSSISLRSCAAERLRSLATRFAWSRAFVTEMWGARPGAEAVTASTGTFVVRPSPFSSRYASVGCGTVFVSQTYAPRRVFLFFCPSVGLVTGSPALSTGRQYGSARVAKGFVFDELPLRSTEL